MSRLGEKIWYRRRENGALRLRIGRVAILGAAFLAAGAATGYRMEGGADYLPSFVQAETEERGVEARELDGFLVNVSGLNLMLTDVRVRIRTGPVEWSEAEARDAVLNVFQSASAAPVVASSPDRQAAFTDAVRALEGQGAPFLVGVDFEISETRVTG